MNNDFDKAELISVEGIVENIVYHNEQNGYCVLDLAIDEAEFITLAGIMPYASEGETVRAMGKWEVHPQYGRQFKVEYYEKNLPATESSMLKYLSSRTVKGIGPITARRIIEKFGTDSFDIIENHPDWLSEIPGISMNKAVEISNDFKKQFGMRNVVTFFGDFTGPATAVKIYKHYGSAAIDIIKKNPYQLCETIHGIGFEKADRIAKSIGMPQNSPERIKAGIIHTIKHNAISNGHVYLPKDKMLNVAAQLLDVSDAECSSACDELISEDKLKKVRLEKKDCVYLKSYYDAEMTIASRLDLLQKVCPPIDLENAEHFILKIEMENGIEYAPMQKKSITSSMKNGVMVLTGGPGTGKTTIIKALIRIYESIGYSIALAAPTGRAAKRMSEATSREAKTIHRLLEITFSDGDEPRFSRDETNYLDEDIFIIDEASMIDTLLMASLAKAIKPGSRLLLIGDSDQLPSVGAGNVLSDIIASETFETVKLREVFRQASESLIVTNAHSINNGEYPYLESKDKDFFFISRSNEKEVAQTVASLYANRLPKTYGPSILEGLQVISPSKKGVAGTGALNALLQSILNPPAREKLEKRVNAIILREGDKVMQIRNNYDIYWQKGKNEGQGIFNGDIGRILKLNPSAETMTVDFDGRIATYDFTQLEELDHAYAVTVHKAQGSEYPTVIIPIFDYTPRLLTRNLLYTAITRAQHMVILVGRADIIAGMVDNNRQAKRYTGLCHILKKFGALR